MHVLQLTTQKLEAVLAGAVAANQPKVTSVFYSQMPQETTTLIRRAHQVATLNSTTDVEIVEGPALHGTIHYVETIHVHNLDTAVATVTVKMDDGGTETILIKQALQAGDSLVYEHGTGWQVMSPITAPFVDTQAIVKGSADATKFLRFEVDGITAGTTRVASMPDADIKLAGHATGLTSTRVPYATGTTGGVLTDSANLTFSGTVLTAHTATIATGDLTVSTGSAVVPDGLASDVALQVGGEQNGLFSPAANTLGIAAAGIEAARFDAAGRLFVGHTNVAVQEGTESPFLQLTGNNATSGDSTLGVNRFSADALGSSIVLSKSRHATKGGHTVVQSGDVCGTIWGNASDGTDMEAVGVIRFAVDGTPGNNDMPGRIVFATTPDGAVSVAEAMRIDSQQAVTMPLQPSFLAYNSTIRANETGDGTSYTVVFDTEVIDRGGDFASNTFTAPVTGLYRFSLSVSMSGLTTSHTQFSLSVVTSNRTYTIAVEDAGDSMAANTNLVRNGSVLADMDAADTATVLLIVSNGTKVVDIDGESAGVIPTFFSGELVC